MAFSHGSKAGAYINGYDIAVYLKSMSLSRTADMAESSAFRTTAKSYVPGLTDATLSGEGLFDGSATAIDERIDAILGAATKSVVVYTPHAEALGSVAYGMTCDSTTHDVEAAMDDVAMLNVEFQSSTGADRSLIHKVSGAVSTNGNGTAIDNAASSAFGGHAFLEVTASTGGNLVVKVQHSADNSIWADLITFTTATAVGAERKVVTGTVNRYTRELHTISAGSATYVMAFGRKVQ